MSEISVGSDEHIAGFIMNKLYHLGCWQKRGKPPRKHHSITNLKKSYPRSHLGKFEKILKNLQKQGIINLFPHTGDREHHVCAILEKDILEAGVAIANRYRSSVGLPLWDNQLKPLVE